MPRLLEAGGFEKIAKGGIELNEHFRPATERHRLPSTLAITEAVNTRRVGKAWRRCMGRRKQADNVTPRLLHLDVKSSARSRNGSV